MPASTLSISAERFADLSSLESCSASDSARMAAPNCSATGPLDGRGAALVGDEAGGGAHVVAAHHDVLAGVGGDAGELGGDHRGDGLADPGQAVRL